MEVLAIILWIIMGLLILGLLFVAVMLVKNEVACNYHIRITNVIGNIRMKIIKGGGNPDDFPVNYDDLEDYDKTLWRLWDWGYTRILPKEKFDVIKPYLERRSLWKSPL